MGCGVLDISGISIVCSVCACIWQLRACRGTRGLFPEFSIRQCHLTFVFVRQTIGCCYFSARCMPYGHMTVSDHCSAAADSAVMNGMAVAVTRFCDELVENESAQTL
jgi:hypothetical protein